jgi:hypothetical protein
VLENGIESIVFFGAGLFILTISANQTAEKSSGCAKHPDSSSRSQERSNQFFFNWLNYNQSYKYFYC